MEIIGRYLEIRNEITDGCLVLISKPKLVSKLIRWVDDSEYSHIGVVFEKAGRLFIIDSNPNGVHPELLSIRIKECDKFEIIKPLCDKGIISKCLLDVFERAELGISYDFINAFKEGFNRKFGTNFKIKKRDLHDICSDFIMNTAIKQDMVNEGFYIINEPFPQDYLKLRNKKTTIIL